MGPAKLGSTVLQRMLDKTVIPMCGKVKPAITPAAWGRWNAAARSRTLRRAAAALGPVPRLYTRAQERVRAARGAIKR